MPKTAEKTDNPTLPLEGIVTEPSPPASKGRAVAAHSGQRLARAPQAAPAVSEAQAMLEMISAAAANPKVNVDKLERLLALRDRVEARAKEDAFNEAMAAAQEAMAPVRADAENKSTSSRYASHAALDRALRPIYTKHGFALSFNTEETAAIDRVIIVCYVTGKGHTRKYRYDMPADGKGAKGGDVMTKTHAAGSAATYGQRYLLKMIFNIAVDRNQDDDGNAAGQIADTRPKITADQIAALVESCEAVGCPRPKFLRWARVERFEDIPAELFDGCMQGLKEFKKGA